MERGDILPLEAVFWYIMTPKKYLEKESVPHRAVSKQQWRPPAEISHEEGPRRASGD